jgi:hypothetical protein
MWNRGAAGPGLFLKAFKEGHGRGLEERNSGSC